jgi:branched-chain amino acid transport system ATP-binding protein
VLRVADELCVLESGRSVWKGKAADARSDPALTAAYLGLH